MTTPEKRDAKMKREFVVTDAEGNVSWNAKTERPETFRTFAAAKKRSVELAEAEPGEKVRIYELTAETEAQVNVPSTSRRHPIEHYS